jgi:hypothetical protein
VLEKALRQLFKAVLTGLTDCPGETACTQPQTAQLA